MARSTKTQDLAKRREAARERAAASRKRRAAAGRPPVDVIDAAIAEAVVRIIQKNGWLTAPGLAQVRITVPAGEMVIGAMAILKGERCYDQIESAKALQARLRRPTRPREAADQDMPPLAS